MSRKRKGVVFVVSGASGSGKTSLCHALVETLDDAEISVSFTTRDPRRGERDGVDYHFIDDTEFDRRLKRKDFAEWAHVHGNRYGTSMSFVKRRLSSGVDVVCDIDYQGAFALQKRFASQAILVFVLPPSMTELRARLASRGTDSAAVIRRRMEAARKEHRQASKYDYLVINDDFDEAADELVSILMAERCRTRRVLPAIPKRLLGRSPRKSASKR